MEPPSADHKARLGTAILVTAAAKAVALGFLLTVFWDAGWVSHLVQDIRTWEEFFAAARAGLVPYVHFTKEYPVLGGAVYWLMSAFVEPGNLRQTVLVHALFMGAIDLVNVALFLRAAHRLDPGAALLATLLFSTNLTALVTSPVRFESLVVTFVLLGYLAHVHGRTLWAAFFWSVGCGLKWYPAFFLAIQEYRLFVVEKRRWHWVRAAAIGVATLVALNAPFVIAAQVVTGSIRPWLAPYLFHAQRPLYWDTLLGVGQIWLGPLPFERWAGVWTLALMGLAVLARPGFLLERKGVLVCLAAVFFNRIYSVQFNLWFYPLLILAGLREPASRRWRLLGLFVLLDVLNMSVFPFTFTGAVAEMDGFRPWSARALGGPWTLAFSAAIVARAAVLAVLAGLLLRRSNH